MASHQLNWAGIHLIVRLANSVEILIVSMPRIVREDYPDGQQTARIGLKRELMSGEDEVLEDMKGSRTRRSLV